MFSETLPPGSVMSEATSEVLPLQAVKLQKEAIFAPANTLHEGY